MRVAKEPTETILADLFTKVLSRLRRNFLLANIVWGPFVHEEWVSGKKRKEMDDEVEDDE